MSKPEDRPTTKALRLQTAAGLKRRIANRHQGSDPVGARHNRREAEFMEQQAADMLALPVPPEIGLGGDIVPNERSVQVSGDARIRRDYLRDVAQDKPDAAAAFASYERLRLAANAGAAQLATEAAETIKAANAFERMLAHQLAVTHKVAMETMARAAHHNQRADSYEYERSWQVHSVEATRAMNAAARLMDAYQRGLLTLQRLRQGGQQTVTVVHQHVEVTDGAQAVVAGALATGGVPATGRQAELSATPHAPRRGWLRHGNPPGDPSKAPRCGARTRTGAACKGPAMKNGRCRMHGGKSTEPKTAAGRERIRATRWWHGCRSGEAIRAKQTARQQAQMLSVLLQSVND